MDQWTSNHLEAWADHCLADDERDATVARMRQVYRQDPDRYDAAGWNTLRRDADVA